MLPGHHDIVDAAARRRDWSTHQRLPRFAPFTPSTLGLYDEFARFSPRSPARVAISGS